MFVIWLQLALPLLAIIFGVVLAALLARLFWHAGSYLKRKRRLLD